jgi:hypothetical protein
MLSPQTRNSLGMSSKKRSCSCSSQTDLNLTGSSESLQSARNGRLDYNSLAIAIELSSLSHLCLYRLVFVYFMLIPSPSCILTSHCRLALLNAFYVALLCYKYH